MSGAASIVDRIVRSLAKTGAAPVVDGNEVRLGARRLAVAVRDDALIWEGHELEDGDWWPAAGPHRLSGMGGPLALAAAVDTLAGWLADQ